MAAKGVRVIVIVLGLLCLAVGTALAGEVDIKPFLQKLERETSPDNARMLAWQRELMDTKFPHTREQALEAIAKAYPDLGESKGAALLDDPAATFIVVDGEKRYFTGLTRNILYRNPKIAWAKTKGRKPYVGSLSGQVFPPQGSGYPAKPSKPYINPIEFQGHVAIDIPRDKLPKAGTVELWIPLPLATASQKWPRVISLSPEKYLTTVPRLDGDIAFAHFAFPMEELKEDLAVAVDFSFAHYQQRFSVDPAKVLPYDTSSAEYQQYTRSHANITVSPEIRETARRIVGAETNPYLAAQKIYRHIVDNVWYSLVPHLTVQMLGIPESVYVQTQGHGDCGAQSMYFSALCRSLGIPARTTGGFQVIPRWAGPHFWAEFYLEGYGWVPVDTTVAEAADWTGDISEEERKTFKYHFFANLDPYRLVIQKDVDTWPTPRPKESMFGEGRAPFVIQTPVIACPDCKENPYIMLDEHTKITYFPVDF